MEKINVKFNQLLNFTKETDVKKAESVKLLITDVINTPEFRTRILNADFKDRRFIDERGEYSEINDNQEILNKIIAEKEQYTGETVDYEWDFNICLYRSLTGEVGHRKKETIFTKKRKFRNLSHRFIASHWIHEYTHVLGFTHDYKRTERRPYSVPYLISTIANTILEGKEYEFLN